MNPRARKAFIVLPVLITLLLAALIGVLAAVQNQHQTNQEATAESVGQDYLSAVATFRVNAARRIHAVDSADAAKLDRVVEAVVTEPPKLPHVSSYGRAHSASYRQAERTASALLTPYDRLVATLKRAETSETFIAAARKVLALNATDYVGGDIVSSSDRVRSTLIPKFSTARDTFSAVKVPPGQQKLAATVIGAVQYVIDQSTLLADHLDARQSFSFRYDQQFHAASSAVDDYATEVQGDVEEAIQLATNDS